MTRTLRGAAAATLLLLGAPAASAAPAAACPEAKITQVLREPFRRLKKKDVLAGDQRTAEGGVWDVWSHRKGALHSIVRTDYSETGKTEARLSFVNAKNYGILVTTERYEKPITERGPVRVQESVVNLYLFCGDQVIDRSPKPAGGRALEAARQQRAAFFDAKELAPYLRQLK